MSFFLTLYRWFICRGFVFLQLIGMYKRVDEKPRYKRVGDYILVQNNNHTIYLPYVRKWRGITEIVVEYDNRTERLSHIAGTQFYPNANSLGALKLQTYDKLTDTTYESTGCNALQIL
jgi:hypothetical protein